MVGTAPEGRGGVAAVVSVLRRHGPCERASVPHVATHRDGTPFVKAHQRLARLASCPPTRKALRNEQALARAHARLPGDDALRDRLAERARATIKQHYSTEVVCGRRP
jgi:hypothetical protein